MVKLQKRETRKIGNKTYHKWTINLPTKIIEEIGFKEGDIFDVRATRGKLILSVEGKKKSRCNEFIKTKIYGVDLLEKKMPFFHNSMDKLEKIYGEDIPRKELEKEILKYLTKKEMSEVMRAAVYAGECFIDQNNFVKRH